MKVRKAASIGYGSRNLSHIQLIGKQSLPRYGEYTFPKVRAIKLALHYRFTLVCGVLTDAIYG